MTTSRIASPPYEDEEFILSASIHEKRGRLYAVVSYKERDTLKRKQKWISLGLPVGTNPKTIEAQKRRVLTKFEEDYQLVLAGKEDPRSFKLVSFANTWLTNVKAHRIQESTLQGYDLLLNHKIKDFFGDDVSLADCKPRLIERFYDYLRQEGCSEASILHYHNFLHLVFQYAVKQEFIDKNPIDRVDRPKPPKFVGEFYSAPEANEVLEKAKDDIIYIPIVLGMLCGLRRSESVGLRWEDVDFEKKEMRIRQKAIDINSEVKFYNVLKNDSSRRTLPLIPQVADILQKHQQQQAEYQRLFGNSYCHDYDERVCVDPLGKILSPDYISAHFPVFIRNNKLKPVRFHDLRHTCASLLLSQNINMKIIQAWLGHSTMAITADIYSHLDASAKMQASEALAQLFDLNKD